MPTRRAFAGIAAALSFSCARGPALTPLARDLSYGPSPSQRLDIYPAAGNNSGLPAPLAVLIHGGGWESGSRTDVARFIPVFVNRSYVVANIDYRLAPEARAPAAAEDARNAIDWLRSRASNWGADARRMLLVGFSAGAHLALLSALAPASAVAGPQSQPRAILSFWGPTDLLTGGGDQVRGFARHWLAETPGRLDLARTLSPIHYQVSGAPLLCAVHSVNDDVVPFAQSESMVAKFQNANKPAKLIRLSHHGHAAPSRDYPSIFDQVFSFLDVSVGGAMR